MYPINQFTCTPELDVNANVVCHIMKFTNYTAGTSLTSTESAERLQLVNDEAAKYTQPLYTYDQNMVKIGPRKRPQ